MPVNQTTKSNSHALVANFNDTTFKPITGLHAVADLSWQDWDEKKWKDI